LPNTPAPAIWVVLVITDADPLRPGEPDVQPLHQATEIAAAAATAIAGRIPLSSTGPTLTSGQLTPTPVSGRRGPQNCSPAHYDSL
jgi:hypothetical protein